MADDVCDRCSIAEYEENWHERWHPVWHEGCAHCIDRANLRERAAEFDRQAIAGMRERAMREGRTSL